MAVLLLPILIGFLAGYFLNFWLLVAASVVLALFVASCYRTSEHAAWIGFPATIIVGIGLAVAWGTYYESTGQTWIGNAMSAGVLRGSVLRR